MNGPNPKGGYQAILQIIQMLGDDGPQEPEELAPRLGHFGYQVEEDTQESPALSQGNYTYTELCEVLEFANMGDDGLELTEDTDAEFNVDASGQHVYKILTSDKPDEVKSAELSSLILLKLCGHDIQTRQTDIENAMKMFLQQLWSDTNRDDDTGRYQTPNNLKQVLTELPNDWTLQKLRYARQRGLDIGVCRQGSTGGRNMLFPVLPQDIFQAAAYYLFEYYRTEIGDRTPNMNDFYDQLQNWCPVARDFYQNNVLYRGMLKRNNEIRQDSYPVLWHLLNQREGRDEDDFRVNWLEGEDSWNDQIPYAEFDLQVI